MTLALQSHVLKDSLSSSLDIVQIDEHSGEWLLLGALGGVHKTTSKGNSIVDVVTAASPSERFVTIRLVGRLVATALVELTTTAISGDLTSDACCANGVDESGFSGV